MLVYKDGITRHIDNLEWSKFKELGYEEVIKAEQPTDKKEIPLPTKKGKKQ